MDSQDLRPHPLISRLLIAVLLFPAGCSSLHPCNVPDTPAASLHSIQVVRRGWHTGIIIAVADWPDRKWPLLAAFPQEKYLEFGWGDERFYQAEETTPWLASRAALWPTASVIHVIGLRSLAADEVQADDIVEVRVSAAGIAALAASIQREFAGEIPTVSGQPLNMAPMPNRFYEAKRSFYFPRMCNWWTAKRLQDAGCPSQAWSVITASRVMRDARGFSGK